MSDGPNTFTPRRQMPVGAPGSKVPHSQRTPASGGALEIRSERPAGTPRPSGAEHVPQQQPRPVAPAAPVIGTTEIHQPDARPEQLSTNPHPLFAEDAQRISLPSCSLFYNWSELQIRPFRIKELAKIAQGRAQNNISLLIDALDATMNHSVRELTMVDFKFIQYWLRLNSFPTMPYPVFWMSKYGNENTHTVLTHNLVVRASTMTPERAQSWINQGFSPPRVRDMEIFKTEQLSFQDNWLYEHAQFMQGDTVAAKIQRLEALGTAAFTAIETFNKELSQCGVEEWFEAVDAHFDPAKYVARLRAEAEELERRSRILVGEDLRVNTLLRLQDVQDEASKLERELAEGKEVKADTERFPVEIDFGDFLPGLY